MTDEPQFETNVLVASSQERVRIVCVQQLHELDCRLDSCQSALECMSRLHRQPVDLLILDAAILWGGADGILDILNSSFSRRPLVFLLMTEVAVDLLYRVGCYSVDDFQIGLHDQANFGKRVRRLANRRRSGDVLLGIHQPPAANPDMAAKTTLK